MVYNLGLNPHFAEFLRSDARWTSRLLSPTRGLNNVMDHNNRLIASGVQRAGFLETMLGLIAGYCPVLSRNIIVRDCNTMKEIFHKIRCHYGFAQNGSSILDIVSISQKDDESAEDLYQRIHSLVDTNLLTSDGNIRHMGIFLVEDEELSPSLDNMIVCIWLKAIHPGLPALVKQKYATQLRNVTICSIREEISGAIPDLLQEVESGHSASAFQASSSFRPNNFARRNPNNLTRSSYQQPPSTNSGFRQRGSSHPATRRQPPSCPVCKQAGRRNADHFLSACQFLPEEDRRFISRARLIESLEEEQLSGFDQDQHYQDMSHDNSYNPHATRVQFNGEHSVYPFHHSSGHHDSAKQVTEEFQCLRVSTSPSPFFNAYVNNQSIEIIVDSGATVELINENLALQLGLTIKPSSQSVKQADGISSLDIRGETTVSLSRDGLSLQFEGLVVRGLESEILAGIPFMLRNDIAIRPARSEIMIGDRKIVYDSNSRIHRQGHCKRVFSAPVICDMPSTLFPSESIEIPCNNTQIDGSVFIEPYFDWISPELVRCVDGKVRITNSSNLPVTLNPNQIVPNSTSASDVYLPALPASDTPLTAPTKSFSSGSHSNIEKLKFNPQSQPIDSSWKSKFKKLHITHSAVFEDDLPGYNGRFGQVSAFVNVGDSLPPQRRGKIPQYSKNNLIQLQQQIDDLESKGVFATPESVDTYPEYINPTFLVNKPGSDSFRLVTSFGEVAAHSKPTPTLASNIDEVLREFGSWKFIIKTDLKKAYYQIPLHTDSRKYCAIVSPFKGVRVYCRAAMGMPGSECALDELMSRMFGDLIQSGEVKRVADDIYVGANNISALFSAWEKVLIRLEQACLRLTPHKTEILPLETSILGWIWREGSLSPSPHHIAPLSVCERPRTVKGLRSYLGAYKIVARCLKHCSQFLAPLESLSAGKASADLVTWNQASSDAFEASQSHLSKCVPINLPSTEDKLCLITDASSAKAGISATLVSVKNNSTDPQICSFFSAKLKGGHDKWLPCEIECLAIASAINHFRPFIINSNHRVTVLTDSKPAVEAYQRFLRGDFSTSSRMQAFLLSATQNNVCIAHISGSNNLLADFGSRNSSECTHTTCSVCKFIDNSQAASVNAISIKDIVNGAAKTPFGSPAAWLEIQLGCPTVQLARKHLQQGTRPMKKLRNVRNVKHLIKMASINKDGLLIVRKDNPLNLSSSLIVVPEHYAPGLITALHLQLEHPSAYQLQQVFNRQFYAINSSNTINESIKNCHQCHSLRRLPRPEVPFSSAAPYATVGSNYSADVVHRNRQLILVMCEEVTKYTTGTFIESEQHSSLLKGLKELLFTVHPPCSPMATVKVDPAPAFKSLHRSQPLSDVNIRIELGEAKNKNKLATIDKQIQELEHEWIRLNKPNGPLQKDELSAALSALNSRIRSCGLSSYEQWHKRNQFDKSDLPISDKDLISMQSTRRDTTNSKKFTGRPSFTFVIGNIVYITHEKTKHSNRPRYIIDKIEGDWLFLRKITESSIIAKTHKIHRNACSTIPDTAPLYSPTNQIESDSDTDSATVPAELTRYRSSRPHAPDHPSSQSSSHTDTSSNSSQSPARSPAPEQSAHIADNTLGRENNQTSANHTPALETATQGGPESDGTSSKNLHDPPTSTSPTSQHHSNLDTGNYELGRPEASDEEWLPPPSTTRSELPNRRGTSSRTKKQPDRYGNPVLY